MSSCESPKSSKHTGTTSLSLRLSLRKTTNRECSFNSQKWHHFGKKLYTHLVHGVLTAPPPLKKQAFSGSNKNRNPRTKGRRLGNGGQCQSSQLIWKKTSDSPQQFCTPHHTQLDGCPHLEGHSGSRSLIQLQRSPAGTVPSRSALLWSPRVSFQPPDTFF